MKIAILGGGLAGLTLANHLKSDFVVFEKDAECGGLCRTLKEEGFTFDYGGSHIIFSRNKDILTYMLSLLGDNVSKRRRNTKIYYKGHYVKYPFENGLSDLPIEDNFECLYTFIENLIKKERNEINKPTNFKEWMYYTFGKGITEKYLLPYNRKIWNYVPEKMSLEWVEGRVPQPPVKDVIKSSLGIETEGYTHQLYFYYPKYGGIQSLVTALEKPLIPKIVKNIAITKIKKNNDNWIIYTKNKKYYFQKIVSTIPLQELMETLEDIPTLISKAISSLKFNSLITVMIGVNVPKINDISWMYFPEKNRSGFHRVSFPSNFSEYVTPKGKSSLMAEITYNEGDDISNKSDEEIINDVIYDLENYDIIKEESICFAKVYRSKYAYVIMDRDYSKNTKIIYDYFKKEGINLCGRFSEFKYLNMDATINSAIIMGKKLNSERGE